MNMSWRSFVTVRRGRMRDVQLASLVVLVACAMVTWWVGPLPPVSPVEPPIRTVTWVTVDRLPQSLARFETVFWEPLDTDSLREQILQSEFVRDKSILEIGTGTGLIAICCLQAGAAGVVATDVNAAAIANARYNSARFGFHDRLHARRVPLDHRTAFAVIDPDERFDLIVSNPPWENNHPRSIAEYALYDPGFQLLESILAEGQRHLNPGGRVWLAYGCTDAIRIVLESAPRFGWKVNWLDERRLSDLPPVFLPGLLLELLPTTARTDNK